MSNRRPIYCCGCEAEVSARLTNGAEIYPHRSDLRALPFWKCDECGNHVGCHHKTGDRTRPLGVIATPLVKRIRQRVHAKLDGLWMSAKDRRSARKIVYRRMARALGLREFHTAEIRSWEEGLDAMGAANVVAEEWRRGARA